MLEENAGRDTVRLDSDSDSDGSEGRSLELASSHSSDEEESSSKIQRNRRINGNDIFAFVYIKTCSYCSKPYHYLWTCSM